MQQKQALVIGSGVGGLAVAARMAAKGVKVTVLEQNPYPGGKLTQIQLGDYRFDAGPSLFTMPEWLEAVFIQAQKDPKHYFTYQALPETTRYFWENGKTFIAPASATEFIRQGAATFNSSPKDLKRYLRKSQERYQTVGTLFLDRPMHWLSTYLNASAFKAYFKLPFLGLWGSMATENEAYFGTSELAQLFNRYATYNGSNPYQAPALMNLIPHLELGIGAYYPKGGMHSITEALYQLCLDLGVKFHFETTALEIIIKNEKAIGVKTNHNPFYADWVVSNLDVAHTYGKLLPKVKGPKKVLEQPRSSSALIFYWGVEKEFPQLGLHNILFTQEYKNEFDKIFKDKTISKDPTVYINITSKYTTTDAPKGGENWFVMINVPANQGQDWPKLISEAKTHIIEKIQRVLGTDIAPYIKQEAILDPPTIEKRTGSFQGALYGNASNNRMAAFLRHANKSFLLKRLYFTGGSVHPGGGIPLALQSGKIAIDLMIDDGLFL